MRWVKKKKRQILSQTHQVKKREDSYIYIKKLEMKKERLQQTMQKYKGLWDYYEQLYGDKIDNLEEMDKFLEKCNFPKLNQEETEDLNKPSQARKSKL